MNLRDRLVWVHERAIREQAHKLGGRTHAASQENKVGQVRLSRDASSSVRYPAQSHHKIQNASVRTVRKELKVEREGGRRNLRLFVLCHAVSCFGPPLSAGNAANPCREKG